ncbi:MAG: helix-turn-helix transcriptional regulator [Sphingopyxis sp.]|nr:helix-turn-helix transcriptional regulator [Sphingopyxis sp.]
MSRESPSGTPAPMALFEQIDLMARGGSIALLSLWSWILLRDHRGALPARLAVAMNVAICCYVIVTAGWYNGPSPLGLVLALGAGSAAGLFWLFARAWFNDHRYVSRLGLALVGAAFVNTLALQLSFPEGGPVYVLTGALFRIGQLAFAIAALWEVWRGRQGDLIEGRRRLRSALVTSVAVYVALIVLTEISAQVGGIDKSAMRIVGGFAVIVIFGFCAAMLGMRQADLFGPSLTVYAPAPRPVPDADDPLALRLRAHMLAELPHRDERLSIAGLAAQLGEPEYRLRRVINGSLGHRNFAQFVNGYRLAEVKAALSDPAQREVSILTIALDAGFGSLGRSTAPFVMRKV